MIFWENSRKVFVKSVFAHGSGRQRYRVNACQASNNYVHNNPKIYISIDWLTQIIQQYAAVWLAKSHLCCIGRAVRVNLGSLYTWSVSLIHSTLYFRMGMACIVQQRSLHYTCTKVLVPSELCLLLCLSISHNSNCIWKVLFLISSFLNIYFLLNFDLKKWLGTDHTKNNVAYFSFFILCFLLLLTLLPPIWKKPFFFTKPCRAADTLHRSKLLCIMLHV